MLQANFWQDKSYSKKVVKEKKLYEDLIDSFETSLNKLNDLDDLNQLALDENNVNIQNEIFENVNFYNGKLLRLQNNSLLSKSKINKIIKNLKIACEN